MSLIQYGTAVTQAYINARQSAEAGGPRIDFSIATLVVGDGGGVAQSISALIAAGGVTHEVWRGQSVGASQVNADNPAQIDVPCTVPAVVNGVEIGPFAVREFAILIGGVAYIVGVTYLEKTVAAQNQIADLAWTATILEARSDTHVLSAPGAGFLTQTQMQAALDAAQAPAADLLALVVQRARAELAHEAHLRRQDERSFQIARRLAAAGF